MLDGIAPLLMLLLKKISSLPGVLSRHTTYTLFPDSAISGLVEKPGLSLIFTVSNVVPPLVLLLNKISGFPYGPGVPSTHTTYTFFPSIAKYGL